jgi:isocitrate/isopropylmalate dehydrogenase
MTTLYLASLPADGIGPEVIRASRTVPESLAETEAAASEFEESRLGLRDQRIVESDSMHHTEATAWICPTHRLRTKASS